MRFRAVFSCAAAAPLLVAAAQPVVLQPSREWVLDYAENSCRLSRTFGGGDHQVALVFESEAPEQVDMVAAGKPLVSYDDEVKAKFLPLRRKPLEGVATQSNRGPSVFWSTAYLLPDDIIAKYEKREGARESRPGVRPPALDLAEEARDRAAHLEFASKTTGIEIDAQRGHPVILETGSLGEPIRMFDKCSRDSMRDWGVDPDLEDKIVRPAWSPHVRDWLTPEDYPSLMQMRGNESDVKVRLLIDATGTVTRCTSLSHFQEKSFNDVVCDKLMKRAHFEPAELADGTKVPSYYVNHIVFRLAG